MESIRAPVAEDLRAVTELIVTELSSDVPLIRTIAQHITQGGGKRLRPLLVLLTAKAVGYDHDTEHHELAAVIEFIHTATLLHDDVIDRSELRRGQRTANAIWDNSASVLVGDFLYSRAFQILARRSHIAVMKVLANTTNQIAEGEVLQLMHRHRTDITETHYCDVIRRKTAQLFSAAAEIGAMLGSKTDTFRKPLADFGLHLGMAYQIIDDLLDYTSDSATMGKNVGNDLAEGKVTLPLIHALHHTEPSLIPRIHQAIQHGDLTHWSDVLDALQTTQAYRYTLDRAKQHAQSAQSLLASLPLSPYRQSLSALTEFTVQRNS
ncbi:MAG: octaprenyl diphosphate synthase [Coxiella sp. RIFCSPHIGHO2_12_FULL_44_14]|nr:MAG: octaprenyl diphosphate synthase [Coxiella sp. RIFCSPHIGHO2_12_FULL_44_14]